MATSEGRNVRRFSRVRGAKQGSSAISDFNFNQADCGWMKGKYFCASSARPNDVIEFCCIDIYVLRLYKGTKILTDKQIFVTQKSRKSQKFIGHTDCTDFTDFLGSAEITEILLIDHKSS